MNKISDFQYLQWKGTTLNERDFVCGYCNRHTSSISGLPLLKSDMGMLYQHDKNGIYICTHCQLPSFFFDNEQMPGNKFGNPVSGISDELSNLYDEARNSYSVGAYTGAVLLCRKLLMNIAVELGAETGKKFIEYVNYLDENHYISRNSKSWVDKIRTTGNEATHETVIKSKDDATTLIKFCEMIMKTNFEYPSILDSDN
ncbi:hypothetical protein L6E_00590 [Enterococcus hirae]|uniref:DUF4145 domain-containing protein n=1 Tax=Enterococcus hirae TaxID=1354 RepID=UPI0025737606|nr:DUF4145 domain-containing protein [Enterococcus hirae]EMF0521490.1 DUF4145 domain-containing protein [Enterococcus hirae]BDX45645.1 hypothetical protein L6E_00590 [Enterococcus hirae]